MSAVLLNPDARVTVDKKTSELKFPANFMQLSAKTIPDSEAKTTLEKLQELARQVESHNNKVGIDLEDISAINIENDTFIERNFTEREIEYCSKASNVQAAYAGRWSAKEAVFKSMGVASRGGGAPLKEIEILRNETGAPIVYLHGKAAAAAKATNLKEVSVSISHSDSQAIAIAVSTFQ